MELEQARKRAEELRVVIERNNRLYYDQDAPELEDFEYDALTRMHFPSMNCAILTAGYGKPGSSRNMSSRSRSTAFPAAWNMKTVC